MRISFVCGVVLATLAATVAPPARAAETPSVVASASVLTWKDSVSHNTIFTSDDVLFFDWNKQYFLLKDAAFDDYTRWLTAPILLPEKSPQEIKAMDVEVKNGLIYRWDDFIAAPSFGDAGPHAIAKYNLLIDRLPIVITSGESPDHQGRGWIGRDNAPMPHDSPLAGLMYKDWQRAGVLKPDDFSTRAPGTKISAPQVQWNRIGPDAHVGVECNGEDFRIGQQPRADFLFATDKAFPKQWDALAIEIRYVANDGQFRSDTRVEAISPQVMADHVYHCQLPAWKTVAGSQSSVTSEVGSITFSLLFQQRRNGQLVTARRVEFDAFAITLRGLFPRY